MPGGRRAMTTRFPAPWRIVEIPNGFAVDDASGQQLGVFYGRADPNAAGHTGFLTIEEARQMAVDFARLPHRTPHPTLPRRRGRVGGGGTTARRQPERRSLNEAAPRQSATHRIAANANSRRRPNRCAVKAGAPKTSTKAAWRMLSPPA